MTFKLLKEIIEKNNIPEDVKLFSDNDWGDRYCCLDGVYYDKNHNTLYLTDGEDDQEYDYRDCLCFYKDGLKTYDIDSFTIYLKEEVDESTSL